MAGSTTPRPPERHSPPLTNAADAAFVIWADQWRRRVSRDASEGVLAVAYSGGADSTAVLLAAVRHWAGPVVALHVHHGLQAAADEFEQHCRTQCHGLGVRCEVARVDARHSGGQSPEEQARLRRYQALATMAERVDAACVLLGQHADDQVETLLLALSRGAGMAGLAAMPAGFDRNGMRFERPLLQVPAAVIRADLRAAQMPFVDDPTNRDAAYTRNRIRLQLLPAIEAAFPSFRETFTRSARHAAQAQSLLDELAVDDLLRVGDPPAILALQRLSRERQANLLRHWIKRMAGSTGSAAQLDALLQQVDACRTRGHRIHLRVANGHVLREGAHLAYRASLL